MEQQAADDELGRLVSRLADARKRLDRANASLATKDVGGEWEEYETAYAALLHLERAVAAARGEEYAEPLAFPVRWCTGAPLPHLLVNDQRAILIFLVSQPDPHWDDTYVTIKDPADDAAAESLAMVEFSGCAAAKLGAPNDEVFHGHPLHGRGMEPYAAQVVRNSCWLGELEAMNRVHSMYDPARWRTLRHFVFWFHDKTFECVAESFTVERFEGSFSALLAHACRRLVS